MSSELMVIQQNMTFVNEGYGSLGETLKSRAAELSHLVQDIKEAQKDGKNMMSWLKDMKKTAASWSNAATGKDSVKTQLDQQKVQKSCCCSQMGCLKFNYVLNSVLMDFVVLLS